jgi:hypothetical protein
MAIPLLRLRVLRMIVLRLKRDKDGSVTATGPFPQVVLCEPSALQGVEQTEDTFRLRSPGGEEIDYRVQSYDPVNDLITLSRTYGDPEKETK